MKPLLTLLFCAIVATRVKAQTANFYGNPVNNSVCSQLGVTDDREVIKCMDKICDAADIPNNFTLQPCPSIGNCYAINLNNTSYILYDINFFKKVETYAYGFTEKNLPQNKVDWQALTILAHELGHHLCQHFSRTVKERFTPTQMELQADEYAGTIMYKLGATLAQAQEVMYSSEVPEEASLTHPGRKDRLAAIAKGWNKEYAKAAKNVPVSPTPTDKPATTRLADSAEIYPPMVQVQGGTFNMGSNEGSNDLKPVHSVTVGDFEIGKFEVTVKEYQTYCLITGHAMPQAPPWGWRYGHPMVNVSYDDANAYCAWLSQMTGKSYRLPTEAEWEYAARGGNKSKGYAYSGSDSAGEVGWIVDNSNHQTYPVGQKKANELGLYDMTGNVEEWCSDWYGLYGDGAVQNPLGPPSGTKRVLRSGAWVNTAQASGVAYRNGAHASVFRNFTGFRVACNP